MPLTPKKTTTDAAATATTPTHRRTELVVLNDGEEEPLFLAATVVTDRRNVLQQRLPVLMIIKAPRGWGWGGLGRTSGDSMKENKRSHTSFANRNTAH